jgi:hypothetical protein
MSFRSWIAVPVCICLALISSVLAADERVDENVVKIYVTANEHSYHTPWQMEGKEDYEGSGCIIDGRLVPREQFDVDPVYFIYGGIIFSPLTENILHGFEDGWCCDSVPDNLSYAAYYRELTEEQREVGRGKHGLRGHDMGHRGEGERDQDRKHGRPDRRDRAQLEEVSRARNRERKEDRPGPP